MTRSRRTRTPAKTETSLASSAGAASRQVDTPGGAQSKRKAPESAGSSAKKPRKDNQPVTPIAPASTPTGSGLRRSTRTRMPRSVHDVSPGPVLARSAKVTNHADKLPQSTVQSERQQQSASAAKSVTKTKRRKNSAQMESHDEPAALSVDNTVAGSQTTEAKTVLTTGSKAVARPALTGEAHDSAKDGIPIKSQAAQPSQASPDANAASPVSLQQNELQHLPDTVTPSRPPTLKSPCTIPAEHGLPAIPHKFPTSPVKPDTEMADAAVTAAAAAAPSIATLPVLADHMQSNSEVQVLAAEVGSQNESRQSSGHSNDHPTAVPARKHLDWDAAESLGSKPIVVQHLQATEAAADESWWDPTDLKKVQLLSTPFGCTEAVASCMSNADKLYTVHNSGATRRQVIHDNIMSQSSRESCGHVSTVDFMLDNSAVYIMLKFTNKSKLLCLAIPSAETCERCPAGAARARGVARCSSSDWSSASVPAGTSS